MLTTVVRFISEQTVGLGYIKPVVAVVFCGHVKSS